MGMLERWIIKMAQQGSPIEKELARVGHSKLMGKAPDYTNLLGALEYIKPHEDISRKIGIMQKLFERKERKGL